MIVLNLHGWPLAFAVLNSVGAFGACVMNILAWRRTGRGGAQTSYAVIALYALFYAVAYLMLAFTNVAPTDWSALMRGVSIATWPLVWSASAFVKVFTRAPHRYGQEVIDEVERRFENGGRA